MMRQCQLEDELNNCEGSFVSINIQEWIRSASELYSREGYIKNGVNLALLLTTQLSHLVASGDDELLALADISFENVSILVQSAHVLSIKGVRLERDASCNHVNDNAKVAPRLSSGAICNALGNILLGLFSKRNSKPNPSKSKVGPKKRRRANTSDEACIVAESTNKVTATDTVTARRILLDLRLPLPLCRLICDLLLDSNANESATATSRSITSLDDALADLTSMKTHPQEFLFGQICPQKALRYASFYGTANDNDIDHRPEITALDKDLDSFYRCQSTNAGVMGKEDLSKMLSSKLCLPIRYTRELAHAIHRKTIGYPIHVEQFIKALLRSGLLSYSVKSRQWTWDRISIANQDVSKDVAELMIHKTLGQLPWFLMKTLQIVACLGLQVEETTIRVLNLDQGILPFDMQEKLALAVDEGIMDKAGNGSTTYKFAHVSIQQAIYESIPAKNRKLIALTIGKSLLRNSFASEDNINHPTIHLLAVDQLNLYCLGNDDLDSEECSMYVGVNIQASKYAIAASNFEQGQYYIDAGMQLLKKTGHIQECSSLPSEELHGKSSSNYLDNNHCLYSSMKSDDPKEQPSASIMPASCSTFGGATNYGNNSSAANQLAWNEAWDVSADHSSPFQPGNNAPADFSQLYFSNEERSEKPSASASLSCVHKKSSPENQFSSDWTMPLNPPVNCGASDKISSIRSSSHDWQESFHFNESSTEKALASSPSHNKSSLENESESDLKNPVAPS